MTQHAPPTGLDLAALSARLHGNSAALTQLVNLMLTHLPARIEAVTDAAEKSDSDALERAAHGLRGSVANFTVGPPWKLAGEIEQDAGAGKLPAATEKVARLAEMVAQLEQELQRWLTENAQ
ncbi:MAG: Hpt domain-containing protein [Myxococcales bacterium]|nr:Hpt domain-containing protein [Myxococcales bacterium]